MMFQIVKFSLSNMVTKTNSNIILNHIVQVGDTNVILDTTVTELYLTDGRKIYVSGKSDNINNLLEQHKIL